MPKFLSFLKSTTRARKNRRSPYSMVPGLIRQANCEVLEDKMLLAAQLVASDVTAMSVSPGDTISIPVTYQTLDDAGTASALQSNLIGFNLHFDSNALTYVDSTDFFAEGIQVVPNATRPESDATVTGDDGDAATDTVIVASYSDSDFALALGWPNAAAAGPLTLYTANFTVNAGFTGSAVNFSANATGNVIGESAEFEFQSTSVALNVESNATVPVLEDVDRFPDTLRPTLTWNAIDGAAAYDMWLGRVSPSNVRVLESESASLTGTTYTPSEDLTPGLYRAWVRVEGSADWSASQTFEIKPTLVHPISATFEARPTFEWNAIPETPGYELFVRTQDPSLGTNGDIILSDIDAATTTWTPDFDLPEGSIRWWVRPSDARGNSGWSDVGITRMDGQAEVLSGSASSISWAPVSGSSRYVLMVQDLSNDEIVVRIDNLQGTSYDLDTALPTGNYRAWVKAIDASTNLFIDSIWSRGLDISV